MIEIFHRKNKNALFDLGTSDRKQIVDKVIEESAPSHRFFLMTSLATIITTLGLITNNAAVVIGGMLVAPFLSPFLSLALGLVSLDLRVILRSIWVIISAMAVALLFAFLIAHLVGASATSAEVIARFGYESQLPLLLIAIAGGTAASYSFSRTEMAEFLPGTIIAVALLPPLATVSIGLKLLRWDIVQGAGWLFALNFLGIVAAAMVMFLMMRLYLVKKEADKAVEKEKKDLEAPKED